MSALLCPLATLIVSLGFLLPWTWGISSRCSSKAQPLLLTLDEGCLLTAVPPDLERGVAPLGPPEPVQPLLLTLNSMYSYYEILAVFPVLYSVSL